MAQVVTMTQTAFDHFRKKFGKVPECCRCGKELHIGDKHVSRPLYNTTHIYHAACWEAMYN